MLRATIPLALILIGACSSQPVPHSIEIVGLEALTFLRGGDSLQLGAVVRDSAGAEIEGAVVTWSSSYPERVTVSPSGLLSVSRRADTAIATVEVFASVDSLTASESLALVGWTVEELSDPVRQSRVVAAQLNPIDPRLGSVTIWCVDGRASVGLAGNGYLRSGYFAYRFSGGEAVESEGGESSGTVFLPDGSVPGFLHAIGESDTLLVDLDQPGADALVFDLRDWDLVSGHPLMDCVA